MIRGAAIWKESIYKNGFKCSCGNQLADMMTGVPMPYVLLDIEHNVVYCNKCKEPVCFVGEMDTDLGPGFHGNIDDYLNTKKS